MKRLFATLFLLFPLLLMAQNTISIVNFRFAESDQTANDHGTEAFDQNGNRCALIRISTTEKGFTFEGGSLGIAKVDDNHPAEVWVYVPAGLRRITIHHPKLGNLYDYEFPITLQTGRTYRAELVTGKVHTVVEEDAGGQYFVLTINPPNATVYVDEILKTVDENGNLSVSLTYGTHSYRIEATGYVTESGIVEIGDKKQMRTVTLQSAKATISVKCSTSDAKIYVDGVYKGDGNCSIELMPGTYILEARKPKYSTNKQTVTLAVQEKKIINLQALEPMFGTLTINCPMADAQIFVNEQFKGNGKCALTLDAGNYIVEARKEGHRTRKQNISIDVKENKTLSLQAPEPIYGTLDINCTPVSAEAWLDGKRLGTTPDIFRNILAGSHELELRKQGYKTAKRTITISDAKVENVNVTMEKEIIPDGYVDLGLPSGTKWKECNEKNFYKYNEAVKKFGISIPTKAQFDELKDKCVWKYTGSGYRVTGLNGNSIFLPTAGYRHCDGDEYGVGFCGLYWSSVSEGANAIILFFNSGGVKISNNSRCYGLSVRLVQN